MKALHTRLRLRVVPGSARSGIVGRHGEAWKVRVAAPAQAGRASDAVLELLAEALAVRRGALSLASGRTSRDKVVAVSGLSSDAAESKLAHAAEVGT